LGIGQFHGILHSVDDGECRRHHRSPAVAARPAKVRMIYLDGAGSYGTNGNDDAAMDAALLSREVGRPVHACGRRRRRWSDHFARIEDAV
jgi:hypothetical protein